MENNLYTIGEFRGFFYTPDKKTGHDCMMLLTNEDLIVSKASKADRVGRQMGLIGSLIGNKMAKKKNQNLLDDENILIGHPLTAIRRLSMTKRMMYGKLIELELDNGFVYQLGSESFMAKKNYFQTFDVFKQAILTANPQVYITEELRKD